MRATMRVAMRVAMTLPPTTHPKHPYLHPYSHREPYPHFPTWRSVHQMPAERRMMEVVLKGMALALSIESTDSAI